MFEHPTYVVLELPASVGDRVLGIRRRYDRRLAGFPAEITVAGSSGIGPIASDQNARIVFDAVQNAAAEHLPILTRFVRISRFATGPVTWLQPAEPAPFIALQRSLVTAGLRFIPHSFPYTPHCTLCTRELPLESENSLRLEDFPREPFELSALALFEVIGGRAHLLKRFRAGRGL